MSPVTSKTVVGVFSSADQARNTVAALRDSGFPQDTISFVVRSDASDKHGEDAHRRGDAIVTVRTEPVAAERAVGIMQANGVVNIDARQSDRVGHDPGVEPLSEDELRREREFYASGGHRVAEWKPATERERAHAGEQPGTLWPHDEAHDIGEDLVEAAAPEEPPRRRS